MCRCEDAKMICEDKMWRCEDVKGRRWYVKMICEDVKQTPTIRRFRRTLRSDALGKTCKTHHAWSTFGSWHVEKMNAAVARTQHISKSKRTKHTNAGALLEVAMSKKWTQLWREAPVQVKMHEAHHSRTTFRSWDIEKMHAIVARSTFIQVKRLKTPHMSGPLFKVQMWFCVAGARDSAPRQKWEKREGFVACPKTMAGVGHWKRIWKDAISRGRRGTRDRDVRRSWRWFPERGRILEHQIFRFAKVIGFAWQVQHFVWPGTTFARQAQHFTQMEWKNCKTHWYEAVSSASQNCSDFDVANFENWRKSRRIASFSMLPTSKIEEVSLNCFVFEVATLKHRGHLGELLRFRCCEVKTLRKSCRIAAFSMLSS